MNIAATFLDYWRDGQHLIAARSSLASPTSRPRKSRRRSSISSLIPSGTFPIRSARTSSQRRARPGSRKTSSRWRTASSSRNPGRRTRSESSSSTWTTSSRSICTTRRQKHSSAFPIGTAATAACESGCSRLRQCHRHRGRRRRQVPASHVRQQEKWVKLPKPITVRLIYQTAFWDGSGVRFRPDVYGWDNAVAAALGLIAGSAGCRCQQSGDVGP